MSVKFLLDENIEHKVLYRLEKLAYTVEHVTSHPELGKGTDDTPIADTDGHKYVDRYPSN